MQSVTSSEVLRTVLDAIESPVAGAAEDKVMFRRNIKCMSVDKIVWLCRIGQLVHLLRDLLLRWRLLPLYLSRAFRQLRRARKL